ncbi:uncharacterized protein PG998_007031 [Apiospora kogelbergensis]|uniref:uncharacterized protein n=1 Tax=Apiospora kogelbergensis TaxID=1337665 RepID=UPI00312D8D56
MPSAEVDRVGRLVAFVACRVGRVGSGGDIRERRAVGRTGELSSRSAKGSWPLALGEYSSAAFRLRSLLKRAVVVLFAAAGLFREGPSNEKGSGEEDSS